MEKKLWLQACWDASAWLRDQQEGAVPDNILNLGMASNYWDVRGVIFRQRPRSSAGHANDQTQIVRWSLARSNKDRLV